jgi:secondary thiamine-phosphate synthase enzyme
VQPLVISSKEPKQVIDITDRLVERVPKGHSGVLHAFVKHTTVGLTTADLDPGGTDLDYLDALTQMIPQLDFRHPHDPAHMPDHILASLIGPAVTVPVEQGKLDLGTWQRVVLFEFSGPREREVVMTVS